MKLIGVQHYTFLLVCVYGMIMHGMYCTYNIIIYYIYMYKVKPKIIYYIYMYKVKPKFLSLF